MLGRRFKKLRLCHFKSDRGEIWHDRSFILQVNAHQLMHSDFRCDITLSRWRAAAVQCAVIACENLRICPICRLGSEISY